MNRRSFLRSILATAALTTGLARTSFGLVDDEIVPGPNLTASEIEERFEEQGAVAWKTWWESDGSIRVDSITADQFYLPPTEEIAK